MNSPDRFVARHIRGLPRSGIRDFFELVAGMREVISLGIGEPDFVTPWHIREASIYALEKGRTHYTSNLGTIELRRAISEYIGTYWGIGYQPEREILVAVGVSEALDLALRAFINPGDKVLYHQPSYVSYHPSIRIVHGEPVAVATHAADGFSLRPEAVEAAWQPGCRILLLNLPCNPTGGVTARSDLARLARFACEKDLLVLSDEIYSELTYDQEHVSIASLPGMRDRTVLLHGFSKAFAMTGFRIGYACAPAPLIEAMMRVHQYSMMCAPILSQDAATEALRHGEESMRRMKSQYQRRRELIVRRLREAGLDCHLPGGAFYAFPSIGSTGLDETAFAHGLLKSEKVAVVPGTAFGPGGAGFVRCSYATGYEQLLTACDRIERFADRCRHEAVAR